MIKSLINRREATQIAEEQKQEELRKKRLKYDEEVMEKAKFIVHCESYEDRERQDINNR